MSRHNWFVNITIKQKIYKLLILLIITKYYILCDLVLELQCCMDHKHIDNERWSMNDSIIWFNEGCQFFKAASGEKKKFNATIRYNLLAMAFEKFVMAILIRHHQLPDNHTFTDLVEGLERVLPLDPEMKRTIIRLESAQQICSFTDCFKRDLDEKDLEIMKAMVQDIIGLAKYHVMTGDPLAQGA